MPDFALRLEKAFGPSAQMWLGMQTDHDLAKLRADRRAALAKIKTVQTDAVAV